MKKLARMLATYPSPWQMIARCGHCGEMEVPPQSMAYCSHCDMDGTEIVGWIDRGVMPVWLEEEL